MGRRIETKLLRGTPVENLSALTLALPWSRFYVAMYLQNYQYVHWYHHRSVRSSFFVMMIHISIPKSSVVFFAMVYKPLQPL